VTPTWHTRPGRAGLFFTATIFLLVAISLTMAQVSGLPPLARHLLPQLLVFLGLPLAFLTFVDRGTPPARVIFRLNPLSLRQVLRTIAVGLLAWAFTLVTGAVLMQVVELAGGEMPPLYAEILKQPYPVALFTLAFLPPFAEELSFRGYILSQLRPLGVRAAIITTGVLFGAMHQSLIRLVPLSLFGIILCEAVQRTRSLWAGSLMHFLNNGILLSLTYLQWDPTAPVSPAKPTLTSITAAAAIALLLGWATFAALRRLGPLSDPNEEAEFTHRMAVEAAEAIAAGEGRRLRRSAWILFLLGATPGLLVWLLAAVSEMTIVFQR
jgi:membrane protease YdiL (CAAX protease family)